MKISDSTLDKIHDTSIVTVAEKLGFKLYGMGDEGRRACCPYHEDQHPSLHFSTKRGCFKCFVCGAKGDAIKLVQDHENLSFNEACQWIIKECNIIVVDEPETRNLKHETKGSVKSVVKNSQPATVSQLSPLNSKLVTQSLSVQSEFCQSVVSAGYLTEAQMRNAAKRYRLGASKDGAVIFWEIDQHGHCHNGKLMHYLPDCHRDKSRTPTWAAAELKKSGTLPPDFENPHCLFGLHLLNSKADSLMGRAYLNVRATGGAVKSSHIGEDLDGVDASFSSFLRAEEKDRLCNKGVAIVESEKTAIICSQLFPDFLWLSCGGLQMFKPELLAPLVAHKVILFPDTDEKGEAFKSWTTVAQQAT